VIVATRFWRTSSSSSRKLIIDIEMPFGNWFDLLDKLEESDFENVFVTAFDNYAIRCIESKCGILLPQAGLNIDEL